MIRTIGVIGAGQMGNGIAHVGALAGREMRIVDADPAALSKALKTIEGNLDRQVQRGKVRRSACRFRAAVKSITSLAGAREAAIRCGRGSSRIGAKCAESRALSARCTSTWATSAGSATSAASTSAARSGSSSPSAYAARCSRVGVIPLLPIVRGARHVHAPAAS